MPEKRKAPDRDAQLAAREEILRSGEVVLQARQEELVQNEKKLQAEFERKFQNEAKKLKALKEKFEIERNKYSGDTSPSDVLRLNIGGTKKVSVLRSTLTCVPDSALAAQFSGRWDDSLAKDVDGAFFIDHDYSDFGPILTFLRNKVIADGESNSIRPPSLDGFGKKEKESFHQLVENYGLSDAMYSREPSFKLSLRDAQERFHGMTNGLKGLTTREGNFYLTSTKTKSNAETIEVKFKSKMMLWSFGISWVEDIEKPSRSTAIELVIDDRARFMVEHDSFGSEEVITLLDPSEENIIRSEDYGRRWYINGTLLVPERPLDPYIEDFDESKLIPCIHIAAADGEEGDFEVIDIQLGD